jgi:hypothetical protein
MQEWLRLGTIKKTIGVMSLKTIAFYLLRSHPLIKLGCQFSLKLIWSFAKSSGSKLYFPTNRSKI